MKKLIALSSIGIVIVGLAGCSKSKTVAAENNNSKNSSSSVTSAASDNPVELKIKWQVGKKYAMEMDMDQNMEMNLPKRPQPLKIETKMSQAFNISVVKKLDDGGWQLQLDFVNESLNVMQGDRQMMSFDSSQNPAQDTNNPVAPVLRAIVGAKLQYFTDANGKVEKIEGVDDLKKRIASAMDSRQAALAPTFSQMFNEDTLKQYASFSDSWPDHPVKPGDSWPFSRDISTVIGTMSLNLKYTFEDWEQHDGHKCAHLEDIGEISTKNTSTTVGAIVEVKKGKISGDVWFDPELGMIRDVESDRDMPMKITTRTQSLTQQLKQTISFSLTDVTP